jgi:hypothetical protein
MLGDGGEAWSTSIVIVPAWSASSALSGAGGHG